LPAKQPEKSKNSQRTPVFGGFWGSVAVHRKPTVKSLLSLLLNPCCIAAGLFQTAVSWLPACCSPLKQHPNSKSHEPCPWHLSCTI